MKITIEVVIEAYGDPTKASAREFAEQAFAQFLSTGVANAVYLEGRNGAPCKIESVKVRDAENDE